MYQSDRGSYRNEQTFTYMLTHSCLGRLSILAAVLIVLAVIAAITCPGEQRMRKQMIDNVRQCIEAPDSTRTDAMDDFVNNIVYTFTEAGSNVDKELLQSFNKFNRMEYHNYGIYSTMMLYNNFRTEGTLCGVGVFGLVIPTINFDDLLMHAGPIHQSNYDDPLMKDSADSDLEVFPDYIFEDQEMEYTTE